MKNYILPILFVIGFQFIALGQDPVYFVINNQTSFHNDDIYLSIQGSANLAALNGAGGALTGNTSYSLTSLLGNLPGGTLNNMPIISSTRMDGGLFNIAVGAVLNANPAPTTSSVGDSRRIFRQEIPLLERRHFTTQMWMSPM